MSEGDGNGEVEKKGKVVQDTPAETEAGENRKKQGGSKGEIDGGGGGWIGRRRGKGGKEGIGEKGEQGRGRSSGGMIIRILIRGRKQRRGRRRNLLK